MIGQLHTESVLPGSVQSNGSAAAGTENPDPEKYVFSTPLVSPPLDGVSDEVYRGALCVYFAATTSSSISPAKYDEIFRRFRLDPATFAASFPYVDAVADLVGPQQLKGADWQALCTHNAQIKEIFGFGEAVVITTDLKELEKFGRSGQIDNERTVGDRHETDADFEITPPAQLSTFVRALGVRFASVVKNQPKDADFGHTALCAALTLYMCFCRRLEPMSFTEALTITPSYFTAWNLAVARVFVGTMVEGLSVLRTVLDETHFAQVRTAFLLSNMFQLRLERLKRLHPDGFKGRSAVMDLQLPAAVGVCSDSLGIIERRTKLISAAPLFSKMQPKISDGEWHHAMPVFRGTVLLVVPDSVQGRSLIYVRSSSTSHASVGYVDEADTTVNSVDFELNCDHYAKVFNCTAVRMVGYGVTRHGQIVDPFALDLLSPPNFEAGCKVELERTERALWDYTVHVWNQACGAFDLLTHGDSAIIIYGSAPIVCIPTCRLTPNDVWTSAELVNEKELKKILDRAGIRTPFPVSGIRLAPLVWETEPAVEDCLPVPDELSSEPAENVSTRTVDQQLLDVMWSRFSGALKWKVFKAVFQSARVGCEYEPSRGGSADHPKLFHRLPGGEVRAFPIAPKWESGKVKLFKREVVIACSRLGIPIESVLAELKRY